MKEIVFRAKYQVISVLDESVLVADLQQGPAVEDATRSNLPVTKFIKNIHEPAFRPLDIIGERKELFRLPDPDNVQKYEMGEKMVDELKEFYLLVPNPEENYDSIIVDAKDTLTNRVGVKALKDYNDAPGKGPYYERNTFSTEVYGFKDNGAFGHLRRINNAEIQPYTIFDSIAEGVSVKKPNGPIPNYDEV